MAACTQSIPPIWIAAVDQIGMELVERIYCILFDHVEAESEKYKYLQRL